MVTLLGLLGVVVVLFVAAVVATREGEVLAETPADVADLELPSALQAEDVRAVRFGMVVRGYRMSEVDAVLDRAAAALAERDARIAELEVGRAPLPARAQLPAAGGPPAAGGEPAAGTDVHPDDVQE